MSIGLTQAHAKFYGVSAVDPLRVILQFVVVGGVIHVLLIVAAAGEGRGNYDGGKRAGSNLAFAVADILEVNVVHDGGAENLGVAYLESVFGGENVERLRGKREAGQSVVLLIVTKILIADAERIVFAELVIDARAEIGACARLGDGSAEGRGLKIGIENLRVDYGDVVDVAILAADEERRFLADGTADIAVEESGVVARLGAAGKRIFGIERGIVALQLRAAVPLVGSRLGENFDAAVAELVVFGRKRILIDADFADRGFWRELAGGEAINIYLAAVRTGGRARESLEVTL